MINILKQSTKKKLIQKTSKSYLIISSVGMLISIIILYIIATYVLREEIDDSLFSTSYRLEKLLMHNHKLNSIEPIIEIEEVIELKGNSIKDTLLFDPIEDEVENFRELTIYKKINSKNYKIVTRTLMVDSEDIILTIVISYLGITLLLILTQYYFNKINTKRIWKPFFINLKQIKEFSLKSNTNIDLQGTDILEFSELNKEIKALTKKVSKDYRNLKQFTEDISHEIQTPLAIIQAKINNFSNHHNLSKQHFYLLEEIQQNINRLSLLNKKLILLTKIENEQFNKSEKINFSELVVRSVENFKELSETPISVSITKLEIYFDENLAQILINNLISNAIKHTPKKGKISISLTSNAFIVTNSGINKIQEPDKLYNRFYKEHKSKKSLGLGLAIVKKICNAYTYEIDYSFKNNLHVFTVTFN